MASRRIIYWIVSRLLTMMVTRLWNILWLFHLHNNCLELRETQMNVSISDVYIFPQWLKETFYDSVWSISKEGDRCQSWNRYEIDIMSVNCCGKKERTERIRSLLSYSTNKWKLLKRKAEEIQASMPGIWTLIHYKNSANTLRSSCITTGSFSTSSLEIFLYP